jgi:hypothetical protein
MIEAMGARCAVVKDVLPIACLPCALRDVRYSVTISKLDYKAGDAHRPGTGSEGTYLTEEPLWSIYTKITTGNYLRERFPVQNVPTLHDWASHLSTYDLVMCPTAHNNNSGKGPSSFHEDYARDLMHHRNYITTIEGYMGLGPAGAQQGKSSYLPGDFNTKSYNRRCHMRISRMRLANNVTTRP